MKTKELRAEKPMTQKEMKKRKNKKICYFLIFPTMLLLALFTYYPFIKAIYLSFFVTNKVGKAGAFVGLRNYIKVLTTDRFINSLTVTLEYSAMVGVGTFVVAMIFAALCMEKRKGSVIYQTMFAMPIALASAPVAAIAMYIFNQNGFLNSLIGTENAWLSSPATALTVCAIVSVWSGVGTSFIYLLVGFRNVDDTLLESSKLDGASFFQRFFKICLPMASPQIFYVVFLNIISSFKNFNIIKILCGTGPENSTDVIIYEIWNQAFQRGRFETACVYAMILCAIIFVFTRVQLFFEKRLVHYQ